MGKKKLKNQIMSGMVWKFSERFIAQGVSFIVSVVLARMMDTDLFGIVAIINVFILIADVLLTSGLNTALIQKQDADELDFSTIFYCNFALGIILYIVLFVSAPFLAKIYDMPLLCAATRVFALRLPISSFQSIQTAYISKKMEFKKFFFSTIIGTIISAIVGIIMAYKGFGVWALIAQYLTNTIIDTLFLFITVRWYPKLMFSWERAKPLVKYGSRVMITDFIGTVFNNLGNFIIGLKYSKSDLAFYSKGKELPTMFKANLTTSLVSVLFPGMSQVNDDASKVKEISRKSVRMLSYITFPLMMGLMVVAEPFTIVLYTEKWIPMVPFIWIVCVEAMLSIPGTIALQAVKSIGRSDLMLKVEFIKKPVLLISILVSLKFGVLAVALTLPVNTLIEIVINGALAKKTVNYKYYELIMDCIPALLLSLIMGVVVWLLSLIQINVVLIKLIIEVVIGGIVFVLCSYISKNSEFLALWEIARGMLKRK